MAEPMTQDADKKGPLLLESMQAAQFLAFSPLLFQAARVLRDRGLLAELSASHPDGATVPDLARRTTTSEYGVMVLLEGGMAAGLVEKVSDKFRITRAGYLIDKDPMTRANMNFVQDVCYRAAEHLPEAIETGKPAGLKELGDWPDVYVGLRELKEPARKSWLEFDHFYSDDSFPQVLSEVFAKRPAKILDVGGNTGKFALAALRYDPQVQVTVADLPGQIAACRSNVAEAGLLDRVCFHEFSILSADATLPLNHDVIWMSQFLCCFSEPEIVHNLTVAKKAMTPDARLLIMDNLWDRQKNSVAEKCLQATSLYFTVVANGNSRMYDSATLLRLIARAGLVVEKEVNQIGWGHTILSCRIA